MPHFRVDDNFGQSEQINAIPARHRLAAVGLWTLAGAWSANQLTDGWVPEVVLRKLGARPQLIDALVCCARLWERRDGGIQFANWSKWQRTRDQVAAYRALDSHRKRRSRAPTKNGATSENGEVSGVDASREASDRMLLPEPEPVVVTFGEVSAVGSCPPSPPPQFCSLHTPDGTNAPCAACGAARQALTDWTAKQTQAAKRQQQAKAREEQADRLQAIEDCTHCDANGYRPGGRTVCDHINRAETAKAGRAAVNEAMGWT